MNCLKASKVPADRCSASQWLIRTAASLLAMLFPGIAECQMINWEADPIRYSERVAKRNPVAQLKTKLDSGVLRMDAPTELDRLRFVLDQLEVPVSSQVLVFSKTSLQKPHISINTPRAIYFNDVLFVSHVQKGLIEIATSDPDLGAAFYTIAPSPDLSPVINREANRCLSCHGASRTRGIPGFFVRSVFPDGNAMPVIRAGSTLSTHRSPLSDRWRGWYVTGTHGDQHHLGNFILGGKRRPDSVDNSAGENQTQLPDAVDASTYLSDTSDIVALMVMEHQVEAYNLLTKANFIAQQVIDRDGETSISDDGRARIANAVNPLVRYLCFEDEAKLTETITGHPRFRTEFENVRTSDGKVNSFRRFDLQSQLFRSPVSYLVHSSTFAQLNPILQAMIAQGIHRHLGTSDSSAAIAIRGGPAWLSDAIMDLEK